MSNIRQFANRFQNAAALHDCDACDAMAVELSKFVEQLNTELKTIESQIHNQQRDAQTQAAERRNLAR